MVLAFTTAELYKNKTGRLRTLVCALTSVVTFPKVELGPNTATRTSGGIQHGALHRPQALYTVSVTAGLGTHRCRHVPASWSWMWMDA